MVIALSDNSNQSINVNVWGELSSIQINEGDVVAINGARVTSFAGKSLNVSADHAKVFINPDRNLIPDLEKSVNLKLAKNLQSKDELEPVNPSEPSLDILSTLNQSFVKDLLNDFNCEVVEN
mmetsp:Transcript_13721/g.13434  ORF Transcript_13721/g.13434 Transcript_13721/m.13434 type:complete len:122 (+) Transcript_13721:118-483(+)